MDCCSRQTYLSRHSLKSQNQQLDTNIVRIKFDGLKETNVKIHQGDPVQCKGCETVLNKFSVLEKEGQFQKWTCEFCNFENLIQIELEEVPTIDDVIYLVESAQEVQQKNQDLNENSIIFCIDNSGSMSSTSEIKGKVNFKHGLSAEEYEQLKQFIDPGDEQQQLPQWQNNTYVSRKQCVLAAIESQISEMKQNSPNKLVGLVTFNNEVIVIGDGSKDPLVITGDRLLKADEIVQMVKDHQQELLSQGIAVSADRLLQKFAQLQEKGQTALGPALLASLHLAGKAGSKVIICTDGLANLGLGTLETESGDFYDVLTEYAVQAGISISFVTIKGEGCRIDILGPMVEKTNGKITRVEADKIHQDFANILKDEVVGTDVQLVIRLHKALQFRNEDVHGDTLKRFIGNATVQTIQSFEYQTKALEDLEALKIDLKNVKKVPIQSKILYRNLNGDKLMRVITDQLDTTEELEKAEQGAKLEILHHRVHFTTLSRARGGRFDEANDYNEKWNRYIKSSKPLNSNEEDNKLNEQFKIQSNEITEVVERQVQRITTKNTQQQMKPQDQDEEDNDLAKLY